MDKVNIGESSLKDFGDAINEAADILNKGKVAFENSIPDKTLQVLPYTGQAGAIIPSKIGDLDDLTTTAKDNLVNAINEVNSGAANKNLVTLDTAQTITGNKFFQADENARNFIRFYPTPIHIDTISDIANTEYSSHLAGNILAGTDTTSLTFCIPADRSLNFSGYSNGFGGVNFEASYFEGHIGSESTFWSNDWYSDIKGVGYSMFQGDNQVFFGVGNISAKEPSTYFDWEAGLECGIVMHATNGLAFRVGDTGKIYVNDKAKSEFQRVLEIPDINKVAMKDQTNILNADNYINKVITSNIQGSVDSDLHIYTYTTGIKISSQGGNGLHIEAAGERNDLTIRTSYVAGTSGDINIDSGANLIIDVAGTISMNAKAISEFKRLLGIQ